MTNLGIPTVSASGAKIGIDNTANPEDDGTIKPKQKKINSNTMIIMVHSYVELKMMKSVRLYLKSYLHQH